MPSSFNTQTDALTGASTAKENPGGMTMDNTTIGATTPAAGTFTTITSTAGIVSPVTTVTTAANASNNGLSLFGVDSTIAATYTLNAPVAGIRKSLLCTLASTSVNKTVSSGSSLVHFGASSTITKLVFSATDQAVILEGVSATEWAITSNVGTVTTSS